MKSKLNMSWMPMAWQRNDDYCPNILSSVAIFAQQKKTKICSTFRSSTVLERLVLWISGTASKKHMGTRNAKKRTGGFLTLACYLVGQ